MTFSSPQQSTNPSLLVRLRDVQDRQAWSLFVEIYGPLIFAYCRRRNLQVSDAADVAQEVFAILTKALPSFEYRPDRGRFRDWLGTITHRELIRFWKRQERSNRQQSASGQADVESAEDRQVWESHFQSEILDTAMKRIECSFEPDTWEMFHRVWIRGESAEKVACAMQMKIGSVYVAKSRVLKSLRAEIMMLSDDWPSWNALGD
jgi:RNA polymerase sigma factor (sigma-70 family)